jgi:hypothetical protein
MKQNKFETLHKHELHNKCNFMIQEQKNAVQYNYISKRVKMHNNKYRDSETTGNIHTNQNTIT